MFGEAVAYFAHPGGIVPGFAAVLAEQGQDGHAPLALARNAPVRPGFDHIVNAVPAPGRNPLHIPVNALQGPRAQVVFLHADEPLGRGPEDHRIFAAPAMRIRVLNPAFLKQRALFPEFFNNLGVGLRDRKPGEKFHGGQKAARVVQGGINVQAVLEAHLVVFAPVARRGVHTAGARVQGDMQAQGQGRGAVIEGVAGRQTFKLRARGPAQNFGRAPAEQGGAGRKALLGQQVLRACGLHQHIGKLRMQANGHIVRQGPGRGGPDDHRGAGGVGLRKNFVQTSVWQRKAHINGRRGMVVIFHLGFGQGRVAGTAPVNGLFGADDVAFFHKIGQFTRRGGLIGGFHAHVGIVPVTQHAQPLELLALHINPFGRVVAAELAHHMGGQLFFLFLELLFHLVFNGQAVAVPAGHIARGKALHVARLDHNILENLVQRRAHVNMAVGIGRAVVQHIDAPAARGVDHDFTRVDLIPFPESFRLALRQIGFHGKGGLRKIQGFLVVTHAGSQRLCAARGPEVVQAKKSV